QRRLRRFPRRRLSRSRSQAGRGDAGTPLPMEPPGEPAPRLPGHLGAGYGATKIIQDTPKRSATMPKRGEKKVLVNGICTCPPSARAANSRSASASSGTVSESEKPWKLGRPEHWPSEAITVV